MDHNFCNSLLKQITNAISDGTSSFLYWGFNEDSILLFSELNRLGILNGYTAGIIDSSPSKQGLSIFGFNVLAPHEAKNLTFSVLVVTSDQEKEDILKDFSKLDKRTPPVIIAGTKHMEFNDPVFHNIYESCLVKSYANGYKNTLIHIYQSIKYLVENGIRGSIVEFGMFKGGTTVFMAKVLEYFGYEDCKIFGFDTFGGFPDKKSVLDMYSNVKCEFKDFGAVFDYCKPHNIEIVKGDICETYTRLLDQDLILCFFDTDNYSPSKVAIETCYDRTVKGGILVFDHFTTEERFIYTLGERMAAKDVLRGKKVFHLHDTGVFMKI